MCLLEKWGKHFLYIFKNMVFISQLLEEGTHHLAPLYPMDDWAGGGSAGHILNQQSVRIEPTVLSKYGAEA